jgi:Ferritin-like domain
VPVVSKLNPMKIGKSVLEMVGNDQEAEVAAARAYNASIRLAHEVEDQATVDLLTKILKMEEGHVDWGGATAGADRADGRGELPGQSDQGHCRIAERGQDKLRRQ